MTTIIYKLVDGFGECRSLDGQGCDNVKLVIGGAEGGVFTVGDKTMRFNKDTVRIDLSSLPEGEYTPTLSCGGKVYPLERIRKRGNILSRCPIDIELLSRSLLRLEGCEIKIRELESTIAELLPLIKGNPIF